MYFPFMRAKQFELVALREIIESHNIENRIIPIIEPVNRKISALLRTLKDFDDKDLSYILVVNPKLGDFDATMGNSIPTEIGEVLKKLGSNSSCIKAYQISFKTTSTDVSHFLVSTAGEKVAIIHSYNYVDSVNLNRELDKHSNVAFNCFERKHTSSSYRDSFQDQPKVILEDAFNKQTKNEYYDDDEYFSDLINTFSSAGFVGFGDYVIVGEDWTVSGGPAHTVAIHLTYKKPMITYG